MNHKTPIQIRLEEQFKALLPDEDAPPEVREEVFRTLDFLNLVGDVTDLFTDKFGKANAQFLDLFDSESSND